VGVELLTERHAGQIAGVLVAGPDVDFRHTAEDLLCRGMTSFLYERKIKIFDYPKSPSRSATGFVRTQRRCGQSGIEIEFIRKRNFRKEDG